MTFITTSIWRICSRVPSTDPDDMSAPWIIRIAIKDDQSEDNLSSSKMITAMGAYHVLGRNKALRGILLHRNRKSKAMFIIAHPDDECMFFSPTILSMCSWVKYEVHILCLSSGDYYKQGAYRENELLDSCNILGVKKPNIYVIKDSQLQDDPEAKWSKRKVADIIESHVKKYSIGLLFTFDDYGVSGHLNHQSCYHGVREYLSRGTYPMDLQCFKLISIGLWRKYISVLDTFYSYLSSSMIFTSPWLQVWKAQKAMTAHKSQFVWFRFLYVMFSRYMIINTYELIEEPESSL